MVIMLSFPTGYIKEMPKITMMDKEEKTLNKP